MKQTYNGREYIYSMCSNWVSWELKESGIDFKYEELPVDFLTHPLNRYLAGIYEYESVKEPGKTVYAFAVERGDIEGAFSELLQSYDKISIEEAIKLEEALHEEEMETQRMYEDGTLWGDKDVQ